MLSKIAYGAVIKALFSFLLVALCMACSDKQEPSTQDLGQLDRGGRDLPAKSGDLVRSGDLVGIGDTPTAWPDLLVKEDTTQWPCVPEAENMCGGDKNQFCQNSLCTQCPSDYKDCDRKAACECFGACNGLKCVKSQ